MSTERIEEAIEFLADLAYDYSQTAPKETVQKFSGTVELYVNESDEHFITGIEAAADTLRELRDIHAE